MGDATSPTDPPVMIPGFTPATDVMQSNDPGINWGDIIQTVLNDVTQIVRPNTPSTHPLYTPTSTAFGSSNLLPLAAIGVVAYLLLSRKH